MEYNRFVVVGTDTDVGKTVVSSILLQSMGAYYWKPIQCGEENGKTDSQRVYDLSACPREYILPELYRFALPASPHIAAMAENKMIDVQKILDFPSQCPFPLIIEGAGGLLVPLSEKILQIDLYERWKFPVILCSRTKLGTINHSLLSIEALRSRDIPIHGIIFIGDDDSRAMESICTIGKVRSLGRLPFLKNINPNILRGEAQQLFSGAWQ